MAGLLFSARRHPDSLPAVSGFSPPVKVSSDRRVTDGVGLWGTGEGEGLRWGEGGHRDCHVPHGIYVVYCSERPHHQPLLYT